ncbi:MAG: tRNA uridine-5-carboxymethylaminomethyl(34) synthesis GTPase MnmE [Candidatus Dependentiae bacterium]|nr:tRNA uridine-5-carboxymethylaminomethyl(34) synthesis GTPase MnmE [Candidatus Dependentiae bacterium]
MADAQTIIAQSTPSGSGAIAIIRLSGPDAIGIVDRMARLAMGRQRLSDAPSHTIHLGNVTTADGGIADQVLFLLMRAPRTFTGEDVVEISCHNNPLIIQAIINRAIGLGAHPAQRGEFTRRAVEQGKIDLVRAEAINELINAQTEHALQKSLAQLGGSLSAWIAEIEKRLVEALALCEASFEFFEGEVDFTHQIRENIEQIRLQIGQIQGSHGAQRQIREGVRIAIIGTVNAGKSSLFNRLLGRERAIVTPIAGTTRDTVEASLDRDGIPWRLIDTAGIRETLDTIEQEGIRRSLDEARGADIVVLVLDATAPLTRELSAIYEQIGREHGEKMIMVASKCDLIEANLARSCPSIPTSQGFRQGERTLALSSKTGEGLAALEQAIATRITALFATADAPFLVNQRHHAILTELETALRNIIDMLTTPEVHHELVAHQLRDALERLSELSGRDISRAAVDRIFETFCVGK